MVDNLYDHITTTFDLLIFQFYYVWSVVEKEANEHSHNTKDSLKTAIVRWLVGLLGFMAYQPL